MKENRSVYQQPSVLSGKDIMIPNLHLNQILDQSVKKWPNHPAISFQNKIWTYAEVKRDIDHLASGLQEIGVRKGDRIALMLPNCPEYMISYYAGMKVGAIIVQINPIFTERELHYVLADSGAETIIAVEAASQKINAAKKDTGLRNTIFVNSKGIESEALNYETLKKESSGMIQEVSIDPARDVAIIQYTGGTTGQSKGAMLTHQNLVANVIQNDEVLKDTLSGEAERILTVIPLFHVYGMTLCMNSGIYRGSCLILLPRFDVEEVLNVIKDEKPTYFPGVPTMYIALNNHPHIEQYGMSEINVCHSGGASMPLELIHEFEQKCQTRIIEAYGLSESSPGALGQTILGKRKEGSVGEPLPGTKIKIVDVQDSDKAVPIGMHGELAIKGPQVMLGYWNMPDETQNALKDGWLYTGDIAKMDEDGHVYIVDRKKDLIIASGYNIYPREIEEVLYEHPAILEAVVVGVPDSYRGETVKAYIVLKPDQTLSIEELKAHCQKNLAPHKVPKLVEYKAELPKTAVGKILRRVLQENE